MRFRPTRRTLIVLTAIISVIVSSWLIVTYAARRRHLAATKLYGCGAQLIYDYQIGPRNQFISGAQPPDPLWRRLLLGDDFSHDVIAVTFRPDQEDPQGRPVHRGQTISDAQLASLRELTAVRSLDLTGTSIGDAGLEHVRHLSNLEKLQLRRTKITDDGIRCLTGLARLQYLDLSETPITDGFEVAHFSAVAGGVRRLRHLPFL